MKPFLPKRHEHAVFGLLLSGMMSLMVSGVATYLAAGMPDEFVALWMKAWLPSWCIAFPVMLVAAPIVRRVMRSIVVEE